MSAFVGWVLAVLIVVPLGVGVMFYLGLVIHILWGWFVTPAFGITAISTTNAAGVILLIRMLFGGKVKNLFRAKELDGADLFGKLASGFVLVTFALIIGYLIKTWGGA